MGELIKAGLDFVAAVLSGLGFLGRPRRRQQIEHNLVLLEKLRASPDFGPGSRAHRYLQEHITLDVGKFSGVEAKKKQPVPWSSVLLALLVGVPLGYWTFKLDQHGFRFLSIVPGTIAGLMLVGVLGMLLARDDVPEADPAPAPGPPQSESAPA